MRSLDASKLHQPERLNAISAMHSGQFGSEYLYCDFTKD